MNVIIEEDYLKVYYVGVEVKGKPKFSQEIIRGFKKKIIQMKNASNSNDSSNLKSLHYEKLSGNFNGKYSIRINEAYHIIFKLEADRKNERIEIIFVEDLNNPCS